MVQKIIGVVHEIAFTDEKRGWTVLRLIPESGYPYAQDDDGTVTIVGTMPNFSEGDAVRFSGEWDNDRRYGMQFKAREAVGWLPKTEAETVAFLSSDRVKGIGPIAARNIVAQFGEATIDILDEDPGRVSEVYGLRNAEIELFVKDWTENHVQRHTLSFLQDDVGCSPKLARRIYTKYGVETKRTIRTDPYRLALDEFLTFKKAEKFARKLGVADGHRVRLRAGLVQAVYNFVRDGHTFAPRPGVLARAAEFLACRNDGMLEAAYRDLVNSEQLGEELIDGEDGAKPNRAVYLPRYWHAENNVAGTLSAIASRPSNLLERERDEDSLEIILKHFHEEGFDSPASEQISAVQSALTNRVSVLTGGPGTGKTATLCVLTSVLRERGFDFALAAPTGRAARRLFAATGELASTIHRLLKWNPDTDRFTYHEGNPLRADMIIIDESSMLDLLLFDSLLKALPLTAHLLLVGDVDQLPSVGAGNVLCDVIESDIAKVTRLQQVHRQDENSFIVSNATDINEGRMPVIDNKASDFFFFKIPDSEKVADNIVEIVKTKVPKLWGFNPVRDIQVIAPMKKGIIGVNELNSRLQQALNGVSRKQVQVSGRTLRVGDKVMQTRNDYDKDVFNGDIGFIRSINFEDKTVKIKFGEGDSARLRAELSRTSETSDLDDFLAPLPDSDLITYSFSDIRYLELAYCITIHKSQGSEFPAVVMPIHLQQSRMLQRNLLYTAITRAKQLVVLVGTKNAIQQAVYNSEVTERHSGLLHRLRA